MRSLLQLINYAEMKHSAWIVNREVHLFVPGAYYSEIDVHFHEGFLIRAQPCAAQ